MTTPKDAKMMWKESDIPKTARAAIKLLNMPLLLLRLADLLAPALLQVSLTAILRLDKGALCNSLN